MKRWLVKTNIDTFITVFAKNEDRAKKVAEKNLELMYESVNETLPWLMVEKVFTTTIELPDVVNEAEVL